MPSKSPLLFVIDNDFGALGMAMYLLHRQPLAARCTLLLPRRAHELHGGRLGVACRPYGSLEDILREAEAIAPVAACLFSGYLLASQRLLRVRELRTLVGALEARGCSVLTTDPYLGTFRRLPESPQGGGSLLSFLRRKRLERHVRRVGEILKRLAHLYPVPFEGGGPGAASFACFNPRYIRSAGELEAIGAEVSALRGSSPGRPRWLFILARFDLELQHERHGIEGFADRVADRLRDAVRSGRDATFIGPAAMVESLAQRVGGDPHVTLLSGCPYDEFERRLLDAEAAFYWQAFSTSAFLRLWNGRPVHFFDAGHNARLLGGFRDAGLKHYYLGGAPTFLDIEETLDAGRVARDDEFRRYAAACRAQLERLPDPEGLFGSLPGGPGASIIRARGCGPSRGRGRRRG